MEEQDTDSKKQTQIIFGRAGAAMAGLFAILQYVTGHHYAAGILAAGAYTLGVMPSLVRGSGSVRLTGHLYLAILMIVFAGLCSIEGGLAGYSAACLSALPGFALLLLGRQAALGWGIGVMAALAGFVVASAAGIMVPDLRLPVWTGAINGAGYAGLVLMLGAAFFGGKNRN